MENKRSWYVVHTKLKHEKRVTELLKRKSLVSFVPEQQQNFYWHGKETVFYTVVFPSMIFVLAKEEDYFEIKKTDGVVGILFWLQKPATVHDKDISNIRHFLSIHSNVVVEKAKVLPSIEKVSTDLVYNNNKVLNILGESEKLVLPSIGFSLLAKPVSEERIRIIA